MRVGQLINGYRVISIAAYNHEGISGNLATLEGGIKLFDYGKTDIWREI